MLFREGWILTPAEGQLALVFDVMVSAIPRFHLHPHMLTYYSSDVCVSLFRMSRKETRLASQSVRLRSPEWTLTSQREIATGKSVSTWYI
jgi:hypothetical protein